MATSGSSLPGAESDVNHPFARRNMALYGIRIMPTPGYMYRPAGAHVTAVQSAGRTATAIPVPNWLVIRDCLLHMIYDCTTEDMLDFLARFVLPNHLILPPYDLAAACLTYSHRERLRTHLIPTNDQMPTRLVVPQISRLYGYRAGPAAEGIGGFSFSDEYNYTPFSRWQIEALKWRVHPDIPQFLLATERTGVCLPFLAIESYGTEQLLWGLENQLAVAAAACLRAVSQLNTAVSRFAALETEPAQQTQKNRPEKLPLVDPWLYCIAAGPVLTTVYIAWIESHPETTGDPDPGALAKKSDTFCIHRFGKFSLTDPYQFNGITSLISTILNWGKGPRLEQTRLALDFLDGTIPPLNLPPKSNDTGSRST